MEFVGQDHIYHLFRAHAMLVLNFIISMSPTAAEKELEESLRLTFQNAYLSANESDIDTRFAKYWLLEIAERISLSEAAR